MFPTRSYTNQALQPQKKAKSLKRWIKVEEDMYYPCGDNKGAYQLCSYYTAASLFSHMQIVDFLMRRLIFEYILIICIEHVMKIVNLQNIFYPYFIATFQKLLLITKIRGVG